MEGFQRYLLAKRTVDDRALNRGVWRALAERVGEMAGERRLRVLEVGGGIGTMVERVLAWGLLAEADYTLLDQDAENLATAERRLQGLPEGLQVSTTAADLFAFAAQAEKGSWDLLMGHAFLDLVDLPRAVPLLLSLLRPGGLCYFTLNFDGATILEPAIDPALEGRIEALYHQTMDERVVGGERSGDSKSGRRLFHELRRAGAAVVAAGSSDWVVFADQAGRYPADEAYFLHFIVDTMAKALAKQPLLEEARFERWIEQRHAQIERGELLYIAHQLDYLGRRPGSNLEPEGSSFQPENSGLQPEGSGFQPE